LKDNFTRAIYNPKGVFYRLNDWNNSHQITVIGIGPHLVNKKNDKYDKVNKPDPPIW